MNKDRLLRKAKFIFFARSSCFSDRLPLVWLSEGSCGRIRTFSHVISFQYGSPCLYVTWGLNNRPVVGRISETKSHTIDMMVIIIISIIKWIVKHLIKDKQSMSYYQSPIKYYEWFVFSFSYFVYGKSGIQIIMTKMFVFSSAPPGKCQGSSLNISRMLPCANFPLPYSLVIPQVQKLLQLVWYFKFSRRRVWCSELSSETSSETSVDNHFTRQYIPEDNSELLQLVQPQNISSTSRSPQPEYIQINRFDIKFS
jgi:hypothetical protein